MQTMRSSCHKYVNVMYFIIHYWQQLKSRLLTGAFAAVPVIVSKISDTVGRASQQTLQSMASKYKNQLYCCINDEELQHLASLCLRVFSEVQFCRLS